MENEAQTRRLTTILSADVVGYSAMMNRDENATLTAVKERRRNLVLPKAEQYHGRTIKLMGDGALMEFASVVDAVSFAVEVQHGMRDRNAEAPADLQIEFRIGINIGDVIVDGDDIYGDGVNIAARLEGLATPGGICVSRTVLDHFSGKLKLDVRPMGPQLVKNIPAPIDVYAIKLNARSRRLVTPLGERKAARPASGRTAILVASVLTAVLLAVLSWWQPWSKSFAPASVERMAMPLPDKPSLVVLPFNDFSDGQGDGYFADGMTEDLITDLSKLSGVFVIARNSSWTYKGRAVKPQRVAEELGVQYILEGSVRRAGGQIRVNAQLIDALGGFHLWADRYDGEISDVFALQDQIIREIVSAMAVNLSAAEQAGVVSAETENPIAYDAVLTGLERLRRGGESDVAAAIAAFEKAIELDPDYSRAYAGLAAAHWRIVRSTWLLATGGGFERSWRATQENLARALRQPTPLAYVVAAEILVEQGRHGDAFLEIDKALALAPNDPDIHVAKARALNATGRAAEAEEALRFALRLNPRKATGYLRELAVAQLNQMKYEETVATIRRVLAHETDVTPDFITLISSLGHLGRTGDVPDLIRRYNEIAVPNYYDPITAEEGHFWWYGDMFGYHPAYRHHLVDGLIKAGVPNSAGNDLAVEDVRSLITQIEGLYYVRGVPRISIDDARALHDKGVAVFVDVRAALDFDAGHIPGSINQSLMVELSRDELLQVAAPDDTLVFSCHGPHCPYSVYGAAKAVLWGFADVRYFAGGFPAWDEAGLPVAVAETQ